MDLPSHFSTGLKGLDRILDGLRIGDNVVWNINSIRDYRFFVGPFVRNALREEKKIVYMRFGQHDPLVNAGPNVIVYKLDAYRGFESFAARVHSIITSEGRGAFYVFDCLSDLLSAWATDLMIGNFFQVTCPYLFELDTVAYFAVMRGSHSYKTVARIRETTQVLLAIRSNQGDTYIHPQKVWQRHSPTMFLPHFKKGEEFIPVVDSYEATNLLANIRRRETESARRQLDYWDRLFLQAEDLAEAPPQSEEYRQMLGRLCRVLIGREDRILTLAQRNFSLSDLLDIKSRMIGTGFIGGKAVGMLLARNILLHDPSFDWGRHLEAHDSFYVGSDVYYSFFVHNGWWKLLMQQKSPDGYFEVAAELREKMRQGTFPEEIREEFQKMLEYFGQYPIIIRSSSLLEDSFGNAFAGKYESFFCVNQGSPEQRYAQLEEAVRNIFASTMSEDALSYRLQRGLDRQEEQMALLIQRVSGAYRKHFYFPELAGVGVSYNTFVWSRDMDPRAGMLRLVLGLGTRAVDRVEGDYPRIVALDAPLKRPHKGFEDTRRFCQREVDLLNIETDSLETVPFRDLTNEGIGLELDRYAVRDHETIRKLAERGAKGQQVWLLTFDWLLSNTHFPELMQRLLKTLETAYQYPVDVEFTLNYSHDDQIRICLVQCRPLQTRGEVQQRIELPKEVPENNLFLRSEGYFMGGSVSLPIGRIILVDPEAYSRLPLTEKYDVARLVGRLNKRLNRTETSAMLLGPGRWGTSTPSLGVPVTFSEINNFAALGEIAFSGGGLMPDLSFGTHFFQDLVEADIFYLALFPDLKTCFLNRRWLDTLPNALEGFMPSSSRYKTVVKVYQFPGEGMRLMADIVSQEVLCFRQDERIDC